MVEIQWHSQTKERATANTNFNLHRRASPRPYLRGRRAARLAATLLRQVYIAYHPDAFLAEENAGGGRNSYIFISGIQISILGIDLENGYGIRRCITCI
jgi:hypothetical protein